MRSIILFLLLLPSCLLAQRAGIGFWQQGSPFTGYNYDFDDGEWTSDWVWAFRSSPNDEPHIDSLKVAGPDPLSGRFNYNRGIGDASPPVYISYPSYRFVYYGLRFFYMNYMYTVINDTIPDQPIWRTLFGYTAQYIPANTKMALKGLQVFGDTGPDTITFSNHTSQQLTFQLRDYADNIVLSTSMPAHTTASHEIGIDLSLIAKARVVLSTTPSPYRLTVISAQEPEPLFSTNYCCTPNGAFEDWITITADPWPIVVIAVE